MLRRLAPLLFLALPCLPGCSKGGGGPEQGLEALLARERAAAYASKQDFGRAREALAPLVAGEGAATEDLLRAAAAEFALSAFEPAGALLDRVAARAPRDPALHYLRGLIARESGDTEAALRELELAHDEAPEDVATTYFLASVLHDLERLEEAERLYARLSELGIESAGSYYMSALYRYERLAIELEREELSTELYGARQALLLAGLKPAGEQQLRLGTFGAIAPPHPTGSETTPTAGAPRFEGRELALPLLAEALELCAHDLEGDLDVDLVARTPRGLVVAEQQDGAWREELVVEGDVAAFAALDLDNARDDDRLELAVAAGAELRLLRRDPDGRWVAAPGAVPALPGPPAAVVPVDCDHDADLDLLLAGPFGARLWRNDGAWVAGGAFVDVSGEAALPAAGDYTWADVEDFDGDNDVDLLVGGPAGAYLADSLRRGRFADASARLGGGLATAAAPLVADFDCDSRPDAWVPGAPSRWLRQRADRSFERLASAALVPAGAAWVDLDLDGAGDLAWDGGALLAAGLPQERATACEGWAPPGVPRAVAFADLDGDLDVDGVCAGGGAVVLYANTTEPHGVGRRVRLSGIKDNKRAVGAVVEVRARGIYRRIYTHGEAEIVGLGPHEQADVLRVRWPNGVVQSELDAPLGGGLVDDPDAPLGGGILQVEGLVGSCPFLYAWNGERFEFIGDVLGITPLGLPMAPGVMVPPDHDEYVLVRGDQLAPKDGRYVVQFTEELREVSYLDRARLEVVDHPAGTEVFPNELFRFPPFPEAHTHTVRDPLAPARATGSDGRDWTSELAALDEVHATAFDPLPPQLQGIAAPWWLELEFDPARLTGARRLRLVMTGWFRWSNASVNMAIARIPGVEFVPPMVLLPERAADGAETWAPAGPPLGFPAGKPKTMVVDVTHLLPRLAADPRLRLACTLQLCWDRIALAVDDDDAELRVTALEPVEARLWERGFSAALPVPRPDVPERFDWHTPHTRPRWDQHPGLYTRHGDVRELVGAVDDRLVVMGTGDALTLTFDATAVPPPPPGFVRDFLVYLDGWAKDRDPNAVEVLEVEPLPFHGMSGYPYGADERFPDDALHRRYRAEWNTRPARRWVAPLSPALEDLPDPAG